MSKNMDSDIDDDSEDELSSGSSSGQEENVIDPVKFFTVKELCYYSMIDKFFKDCAQNNITNMIDIIEGKSDISLRILDWFVTKYSKKKIDYGNKDTEIFDVRISYKSQLKSYKKRYFDPFRRRKKFVYYFKNNKSISTTLGQLNFFKWAVSNNVISYVEKNLKHISKEMNTDNKITKAKIKPKIEVKKINDIIVKKKQKEMKSDIDSDSIKDIKINATKTTDNNEVKIVLKFD